MKIDVTEKASTKLAEELRKSKELVKELRELEKRLEILKRKNNLEKGRKRPRNEDISDENLNKKKCEPCNPTASKTNEKSGDGVPTSTSSPSKPAKSEFKESRREESEAVGGRRCKEEVKVKRERQESWEPSDVEENFDLRSVLHEKQKQEAEVKRSESSWHRAQQQEKGSYHDGGGEGRWEFGRHSYTKWPKWNFEPRRIPEPDPNWPQQMQVKIGPLPGHVSREQLESAVREVGDLRRLFLQDQHIQLRPTEIRYAYVVFKEAAAAGRLLKAACINVAGDHFKV